MKRFLLVFAVFLWFFNHGKSQLANGATAPDFTVTDLNGNSYNLYSLLDSGIDVVIDVSATWCGPCWNYHNSGVLDNIYHSYGPGGTGNAMVFFIEGDPSTNLNCLYGPSGCVGGTQGNWVAGTPYPIIHEEGPSVRSAYQVNAFPTIFLISSKNRKSYTNGGGGPSQSYIESYLLESFQLDAFPNVTDATCGGDGSISLDIYKGYGNIKYSWSNGAKTKDITNLSPGVYTCTISDGHNYEIVTEPIYVGGTFSPLSAVQTLAVDPNCYGGNNGIVTFFATGGTPNYYYLWDDGQTGETKYNCAAGEHHVTITDDAGCVFENFAVLIEPEQIESTVTADEIPCGEESGTVIIAAQGGTPPFTYNIGGGAQSSGTFENVSPGNYTYTVIDKNSCAISNSFALTAKEGPTAVAAPSDILSCTQSEVELSGEGSSSGDDYTYTWTTTDGVIVSGQDSIIAIVSAAGIYVLEVKNNANGCIASASVVVEQSTDVPQASIATPDDITCLVATVTLNGQINGEAEDFEISWTTSNGNIVSGENTLTPIVDKAGSYILNIVSKINGCNAEKSVIVVEDINTPTGEFTYTFEDGVFVGNPQMTSSTNTYLWDLGNGVISDEENPTIDLGEGEFEVCLTVTNECGSDKKCITVTNLSVLTVGTSSTNITCFGENNGTASVEIIGGIAPFTYEWTGPNGFTSSDASLTGLASGTYTVKVSDANGAEVVETVEVTQPDAITTTSVNIVNDIQGNGIGSISVKVEGGTGNLSYLWSNGATTPEITGLTAGNYSCTITDENGCQKVLGPFVLENTTSVDEAKYIASLNIFPNPTSDIINLNVAFINRENVTLEVNNNLGRTFIVKNYENNINDKLDISTLPGGVYHLVLTGSDFKITRRVIVIK